jgi:GntR family phosphonate transport system transcriptional regulator
MDLVVKRGKSLYCRLVGAEDPTMDMQHDSGVALWRRMVEALETEIRQGVFKPGGRFLTETEIADRFGVHRHTARRTVAELSQRGLVRVERGHGTFVEDALISYAVSKRTSFSANLIRQRKEPGHRIIERHELEASAEVAKLLEIKAKSLVYVLETVGEADGVPISVSTNYFPAARFPGLLDRFAHELSITKVMRHFGVVDYRRRSTKVTSELPTAADAKLLKQLRTQPVLVAHGVDVDAAGVPISCKRVRFAGERVQLTFDFDEPRSA